MSHSTILYSIIIPTYNRASRLGETIASCVNQDIDSSSYEIIIIDDGSTNTTLDVVHECIRQYSHHTIRYYKKDNGGSGSARNLGISVALGSILFFTDDDCVVPPSWLRSYAAKFEEYPDVVGVGGWYKNTPETSNRYSDALYAQWWTTLYFFETTEVHGNDWRATLFGNTANIAYRREIFDRIGLFNETLPRMVDWEFRDRVFVHRLPTLFVPLVFAHDKPLDFRNFVSMRFRYGWTHYHFRQIYPHVTDLQLYQTLEYINRINAVAVADGITHSPVMTYVSQLSLWLGYVLSGRWHALWPPTEIKPYISTLTPAQRAAIARIPVFTLERRSQEPVREMHSIPLHTLQYHAGFQHHKLALLEPSPDTGIKVSVVMPFFNRAEFLPNIIAALSLQTVHPSHFEIIIVDDGSTDGLVETFETVAQMFPHLTMRYIHKPRGGAASARNFGACHARGQYMYFIDSDVVPPVQAMSLLCALLHLHPNIVAAGGGQATYQQSLLKKSMFNQFRNGATRNRPNYFYKITNRIRETDILALDTANIMYERHIFLEAGGFDESYTRSFEDLELAFRLQKQGHLMLWAPIFVENVRFVTFVDMIGKLRDRAAGCVMHDRKYPGEFAIRYDQIYSRNLLARLAYWAIHPSSRKTMMVSVIQNFFKMQARDQARREA